MDDHEDSEKRERVLLRPWLENLIESGSIPGLEWMDNSKTMFKVPWKHRSKKTWSLRHSSIFLEWAKNTGRWSEGDPEPNYAQLKTRLRCAFNKAPDIEEMRELHRTKAEEPFKVYKFIPRKESKLYPFGRRPLRKTTIPITVRRRRYFISRAASTYIGVNSGRRAMLSVSSSARIKEEKEDVSDNSYKEMLTEDNSNVPAINQPWQDWLPDKNQRLDGGGESAWPLFYENETKDQINRILPLIVEEANTNSMDLELPIPKDKEAESTIPSTILPEIIEDQIDRPAEGSVDTPFIGIPSLLRDNLMAKEGTRNQEILSSCALTSEKLEYLKKWHQDSSAIYATSQFANRLSTDDIVPDDGICNILPRVNGSVDHSDSLALVSGPGVPAFWPRSGPEARSNGTMHFPDHFVQEKQPPHSVQAPETIGRHKTSDSVPAARLLPLKKLYTASQAAFGVEKSSVDSRSIVQEKRVDAVVKPNVIAQPRVAVTIPYDDKSTAESKRQLAAELVLDDANKGMVRNDASLPDLEVIDLSAKVSSNEMQNSESKVLDLTKKMVVTPFERDCHVNMWRNSTKISVSDAGKGSDENLVNSDPVTSMSEILKFKSEYKRKKQLIVTKTLLLVEKEKELKAREKQLAAREEALFWKETYLHRVLSGLDYNGVIPTSRGGSMIPFTTSVETHRSSTGLTGSSELKKLASPGLTLFMPQHGSMLKPVEVTGRLPQRHTASLGLTQPEHLYCNSEFQISSRDGKDGFVSSAASSASFSSNPRHVPISATHPVTYEDSKISSKASLLLSGDHLKYNGSNDLHFEPETDVALGDAYSVRKLYPPTAKKSQPEAAPLSLAAPNETPLQPLPMTRKRGRPKGSKNKVKLANTVNIMSPPIRQMPPLLVIQSSGAKDIPTPNAQQSLSFHVTDCHEDLGSSAAYPDKSREIDAHGCRIYETNRRILPPVTTDSGFGFSHTTTSGRAGLDLLTSEPAASNPLRAMHSSLFDRLPNRDVMPETVRQLLVSASRPVSAILPPLSPPKSPDGSSPENVKAAFIRHHDKKPSDEEKVITSVC